MTPAIFHNFEVSQGICNHPLKNYGFVWNAILRMCKKWPLEINFLDWHDLLELLCKRWILFQAAHDV